MIARGLRTSGGRRGMGIREEVLELNETFSKMAANHDLDGAMALYTPDAKVLPPGAPMCEGTSAIRDFLQMFLKMGFQSIEFESLVVDGTEDFVVDVGRYRLRMQPPGTEPMLDVGKYIAVFKRQMDGSLRMAYDTFNSDHPTLA
jgi:ketosteroid isomerase-like protein